MFPNPSSQLQLFGNVSSDEDHISVNYHKGTNYNMPEWAMSMQKIDDFEGREKEVYTILLAI